jgi:hypothetical protein
MEKELTAYSGVVGERCLEHLPVKCMNQQGAPVRHHLACELASVCGKGRGIGHDALLLIKVIEEVAENLGSKRRGRVRLEAL